MNSPIELSFEKSPAAVLAPVCVSINGRFLTQSVTGVQRYAIEFIRALDGLIGAGEIDAERYTVNIVAPKGARDPQLEYIGFHRKGRMSGHLWEQLELPWFARNAVLVNLCNTAPFSKMNQVVTIHDAAVRAVPHAYSRAFRTWYELLIPLVAKMSKRIFTVSKFSKQELQNWLSIPEQKCIVLKEGKEHIDTVDADDTTIARLGLANRPYVLAVSSTSPNKNFGAIVEAIQCLGDVSFDVVIAGGANPRIFAADGKPLPTFVKHVGYVSDGELKALYKHASCFVYPSLYEGFGLPPLEAMACGCPVIVSHAASLPEVCGDAALYCDPKDPRTIAEQIARLMTDEALRKLLSERGLERALQFSWKQCAREMWQFIEKLS